MRRILIATVLSLMMTSQVAAQTGNSLPKGSGQTETMKFTCYCPESCPGTITASGKKVREGIVASSKERVGGCYLIWTMDGQFLGYFEALDVGGTEGIRNNKVLDVWTADLKEAHHLMEVTGGEVQVQFIPDVKG